VSGARKHGKCGGWWGRSWVEWGPSWGRNAIFGFVLAVGGALIAIIQASEQKDDARFVAGLAGWTLFAVGLLYLSVFVRRAWQGRIRRLRERRGLCTGCGYDLRGLEGGRCPECGYVNRVEE
jgi:hypothetical protein